MRFPGIYSSKAAMMVKVKQHFKKEIWLVAVLLLCSLALALFFVLYGKMELFPAINSLIITTKEREAVQVGRHLQNMLIQNRTMNQQSTEWPQLFEEDVLPVEIGFLVNHARQDFGIHKVKVFNASGLIIYSTTREDIGSVNNKAYFHDHVAKGKTLTYLVHKEQSSLENQYFGQDVVETYVPIMDKGVFVGAFEIYYDVSGETQLVSRLSHRTMLLGGGVGGFLFVLACGIALQATRNIHILQRAEEKISQQAEELHQRNDELSILYDLSKVTSRSLDIDALLQSVLYTVLDHLAFLKLQKRGVVFLCRDNKMEIKAQLGIPFGSISCQQGRDPRTCFCGKCAEDGRILIADQCKNVPDGMHPFHEHGHIILPLTADNKVLGVLCLYTVPHVKVDKHYLQLLEGIGNQIGGAIEKALLYGEVKNLSLHDPLTGLPNRRLMKDCLRHTQTLSQRYERSFSVIMADIDHFKDYNDRHGHAAGDKLLHKVATLLQNGVRGSDLVARYGGEEFLLVLPETGGDEAGVVAEQIRCTIEQETDVTISCGYAQFNTGMGLNELVEVADKALYRAKQDGRNRVAAARR